MVRSNKTIVYLFTSLSTIILWGFIASIALEIEYRYIGLIVSALISAIILYYIEYLTFSSRNINKELITEFFTVTDLLECYKLSASISADYKDLYRRGKPKQDVDLVQEFQEISGKKSVKFERELFRKGFLSCGGCAGNNTNNLRRYNSLKDRLKKARIAEIPALAELREMDDEKFNDIVYVHQMREFAAFEHTLYGKMINKENARSTIIRNETYERAVSAEENIGPNVSEPEFNNFSDNFRPASVVLNNYQGQDAVVEVGGTQMDNNDQSTNNIDKKYIDINVINLITKCNENFALENESIWDEDEIISDDVFTDQDFPFEQFKDPNIHWLRIKETSPENCQPAVFMGNIKYENVTQGSLGDCWLLSAMISITVLRPDLIIRIFHPQSRKYNPTGYYRLRFFFNGTREEIAIDDTFPCDKLNYPVFSKMTICEHRKQKEIWPLLIEKAMAKAYGGYGMLKGGSIDTAFLDMTGGASLRIDFTDPATQQDIALYSFNPKGSLFEKLKRFFDEGYLLGASTDGSEETVTECKIVKGHAYAILDIISFDGHHLLQLKNPWGKIEWNGDWSENSTKWYDRMRKYIKEMQEKKYSLIKQQFGINRAPTKEDFNKERRQNGVFWMAFDDFVTQFSFIYGCKFFDSSWYKELIRGEWKEGCDGGCSNFRHLNLNPHYIIDVERNNTKIFILLVQEKKQLADGNIHFIHHAIENEGIGFEIYNNERNNTRIGENQNFPESIALCQGGYQAERQVSLDIELNIGSYFIIPTTFYPKKHLKYYITIWHQMINKSTKTIQVTKLE